MGDMPDPDEGILGDCPDRLAGWIWPLLALLMAMTGLWRWLRYVASPTVAVPAVLLASKPLHSGRRWYVEVGGRRLLLESRPRDDARHALSPIPDGATGMLTYRAGRFIDFRRDE